jgi:hypothetical protein
VPPGRDIDVALGLADQARAIGEVIEINPRRTSASGSPTIWNVIGDPPSWSSRSTVAPNTTRSVLGMRDTSMISQCERSCRVP